LQSTNKNLLHLAPGIFPLFRTCFYPATQAINLRIIAV